MKKIQLLFAICFIVLFTDAKAQQLYIYVSDAGNFNNPPWQILRYNSDGSNPQVLIDNDFFISEGLGWPQDIVFLEDDNTVLISHLIGGRITKHNADTGAYIEDFAAVAGGPTRMKIGADNLLYVLQWSNSINKVLRFQLNGTPEGEYTSTGVVQSIGIDWDSAGNLYVSSFGGGGTVHKFDTAGTFVEIYANTELAGPTNLWFDDSDHMFVLDWTAGNVEEYDQIGQYVDTFTTGLPQAEGVDFLPNGNILIGNGGNASVDQFEPDGTPLGELVLSGSGNLLQPNAVVLREATFGINDTQQSLFNVAPTVGTIFEIQPGNSSLDAIEIYNIQGKLIDQFSITESTIWNASHLPEGIYFMIGSNIKGARTTQKLLVFPK